MAGLGQDFRHSEEQLRDAFDAARTRGDDIMVHYEETDIDLFSSMEWMMDCYARIQKTRSFKRGEMPSSEMRDVIEHMAKNGTGDIIGVYDLRASFEDAVHTREEIAVNTDVAHLQTHAEVLARKMARESRHWLLRIFG